MRRRVAILTALLAAAFAGSAFAAQPIYRNNVLTAQHVLVPGTHVRIVPPSGARSATSFRGFEIVQRQIQIRIEERMGLSFQQTVGALTPVALGGDGITVQDSSKVTLNGNPALLLYCSTIAGEGDRQEIGLLIFAFGDENVSSLIYGAYPLTDKGAVALLRNSLLTAILQTEAQPPNAGGGYRISAEGTAMKFVGEASMVRHFTVGGKPLSSELEDALYTSAQRSQQVPQAEWGAFADQAMEQYMSNYEHTVASKRSVSYAGLQGFETIADFQGAKRRDRTASGAMRYRVMPGKAYQVILFDPKGVVYTFNGIAVRDADSYLSQFKAITGTFQLINIDIKRK